VVREVVLPEVIRPIDDLIRDANEFGQQALSKNTKRAYSADLAAWQLFALDHGIPAFPVTPPFLKAYIADMDHRKLKVSTIRRRCIALRKWHLLQGQPPPTTEEVETVLQGLARTRGTEVEKKRALTVEMLKKILSETQPSPRDRAILLVGFWTGMRRSELVAMCWSHLHEHKTGLTIRIPRSKTDQEGKGQYKGLRRIPGSPWCPVAALEKLKERSKSEFVFACSDRTIALVVKRSLEKIGENPDEFGAHSFRHGFVTESQLAGAKLSETMQQTGHKSPSVVQGYMEQQQVLDNPALDVLMKRFESG
jgi:integrase